MSSKRYIQTIVPLVVMVAVLSAPLVFLPEVSSSSEAREVHTAWIISNGGDWVLPLRNGIIPSKPPLLHWLSAVLGVFLGGVSPFVVRLVSLLAGCAALLLTGLLSCRLVSLVYSGQEERNYWNTYLPTLAIIVLSTSYMFVRMMTDARVDMVFSSMVMLALYAGLSGQLVAAREPSLQYPLPQWGLFYGSCALAVLGKGPLGLVLPLLIVASGSVYMIGFKKSLVEFIRPRIAWLVFLILALPWYIAAYAKGGDAFLWRVLFENVERFIGSPKAGIFHGLFINHAEQHAHGVSFMSSSFLEYLPNFLSKVAPWSWLFFTFVLRDLWCSVRLKRSAATVDNAERYRFLCALWFLVGLAFFSLAMGRRHSYLLPLLPAASIYVAWHLIEWWRGAGRKMENISAKSLLVVSWILLVLNVLLLVILWPALAHLSPPGETGKETISWLFNNRVYLTLSILFVLAGGVLFLRTSQILLRALTCWLVVLCMLTTWIAVGLSLKAQFKDFPKAAELIKSKSRPEQPLILIRKGRNEYFDPVMMYLKRPVSIQLLGKEKWQSEAVYFTKQALLKKIRTNAGESNIQLREIGRHKPAAKVDKGDSDYDIVVLQVVSQSDHSS